MKVTIQPGKARGIAAMPASKSVAHRLLICAGLSEGTSRISGVTWNEDILETLDCLRALGASCTVKGDTVIVEGVNLGEAAPNQPLCCRESGSTLRFLIPPALLCGKPVTFTGSEKLLSRPLGVYGKLCTERQYLFEQKEGLLQVKGPLTGGIFEIPGNISSQFVTGLLLALPLTAEGGCIRLTTPPESGSYIGLTVQALKTFGVEARWRDSRTLFVPGGQRYIPQNVTVEGDYSAAAFFGALNALDGEVEIRGLRPESLQGDKVFAEHLQSLCTGCPRIDLSDFPDLGPVLFAVAAAKNGAVFTGTRRLKFKESDRTEVMAKELSTFGVQVTVEENTVTVNPAGFHAPNRTLEGHNDHRVVMALAVLLTLTGGEIAGAEAVNKSFPDFFEKLTQLGIKILTEE